MACVRSARPYLPDADHRRGGGEPHGEQRDRAQLPSPHLAGWARDRVRLRSRRTGQPLGDECRWLFAAPALQGRQLTGRRAGLDTRWPVDPDLAKDEVAGRVLSDERRDLAVPARWGRRKAHHQARRVAVVGPCPRGLLGGPGPAAVALAIAGRQVRLLPLVPLLRRRSTAPEDRAGFRPSRRSDGAQGPLSHLLRPNVVSRSTRGGRARSLTRRQMARVRAEDSWRPHVLSWTRLHGTDCALAP